jgi:hypothetical protein
MGSLRHPGYLPGAVNVPPPSWPTNPDLASAGNRSWSSARPIGARRTRERTLAAARKRLARADWRGPWHLIQINDE